MSQQLSIIVLAAGKGTRMKSNEAKVLHEVFYAPMVEHVISATSTLQSEKTIVVVGHQKEKVQEKLSKLSVVYAVQTEQLGTGHAVLSAEQSLTKFDGNVLILCGDTPLIQPQMLHDFLEFHSSSRATVTLLTTMLEDPTNYGRIISDEVGNISGIVEHKDANDDQLLINEINAGIYCVDKRFLFETLNTVGTNNSQGEVYLTDIVHLAVQKNLTVKRFMTPHSIDVLGVNSRLELSKAENVLQQRFNESLMAAGVSMIQPETIRISPDSIIEPDVLIEPNVHICHNTRVGRGTVIEQGVVLKDCTIGNDSEICASSYLVNCNIEPQSYIAPHTVRV